MQNFEFYAPTRMIFGKDTHKQVGKLVKEYGFKKVFVHYGGASAQKSGLLDTVLDALKAENIDYVTLGGVQANPTLAMAREGIELGKKEGVDFILAVGGGSVIRRYCKPGCRRMEVLYERGNSKGCSAGRRYPYTVCNRK